MFYFIITVDSHVKIEISGDNDIWYVSIVCSVNSFTYSKLGWCAVGWPVKSTYEYFLRFHTYLIRG